MILRTHTLCYYPGDLKPLSINVAVTKSGIRTKCIELRIRGCEGEKIYETCSATTANQSQEKCLFVCLFFLKLFTIFLPITRRTYLSGKLDSLW